LASLARAIAAWLALGTLAAPASAECPPLRCLDDKPVLAPPGPYQLSVEGGVAIGSFVATYGQLRLGFGRSFWNRLEVEATLQLGFGDGLFSLSESARAGVLLHLSRRVDVFLGWRVGYAHLRVELPAATLWLGALWVAMLAEVRIAITPSQVLRFAPVVATGYWNEIWGFTLDPSLGLSYRF
jgi:hypothetical protein